MLLIMTVLGVTAMQMSRMEERMAGNSRDINLAFQGAEAGLRDSEARHYRADLAAGDVFDTAVRGVDAGFVAVGPARRASSVVVGQRHRIRCRRPPEESPKSPETPESSRRASGSFPTA